MGATVSDWKDGLITIPEWDRLEEIGLNTFRNKRINSKVIILFLGMKYRRAQRVLKGVHTSVRTI